MGQPRRLMILALLPLLLASPQGDGEFRVGVRVTEDARVALSDEDIRSIVAISKVVGGPIHSIHAGSRVNPGFHPLVTVRFIDQWDSTFRGHSFWVWVKPDAWSDRSTGRCRAEGAWSVPGQVQEYPIQRMQLGCIPLRYLPGSGLDEDSVDLTLAFQFVFSLLSGELNVPEEDEAMVRDWVFDYLRPGGIECHGDLWTLHWDAGIWAGAEMTFLLKSGEFVFVEAQAWIS